jgi:uncharacterized protein
MDDIRLPGLPFALVPQGDPPCEWEARNGTVVLTGAARTDLFVDPASAGGTDPAYDEYELPTAGRMVGRPPAGDFTFSARVTPQFDATYDAGVLLIHAGERRFAKLCFEFSPQGAPTAVSVVTRGTSDDCNSFEVNTPSLWMRITRVGRAWAFHVSADASWWRLVRYFSLDEEEGEEPLVGLLAQSPTGKGCAVVFDELRFTSGAPQDLRNGT